MEIRLESFETYCEEEVLSLYRSVGWKNYTEKPAMLRAAWQNSLCVMTAREDGRLVGAVRAVGDGASVLYVQDIIVHPDYQRRGIGTRLLRAVLDAYPQVYQTVLLTDDRPATAAFYESLGFSRAPAFGCTAFVRFCS